MCPNIDSIVVQLKNGMVALPIPQVRRSISYLDERILKDIGNIKTCQKDHGLCLGAKLMRLG